MANVLGSNPNEWDRGAGSPVYAQGVSPVGSKEGDPRSGIQKRVRAELFAACSRERHEQKRKPCLTAVRKCWARVNRNPVEGQGLVYAVAQGTR